MVLSHIDLIIKGNLIEYLFGGNRLITNITDLGEN